MDQLNNLDWRELIDRLARFAKSEVARRTLLDTRPLASADHASASFRKIAEMADVVRRAPRPHMESLDLFTPWHQRLCRNAVLKTLEIKDVRHFCLEALALREILQNFKTPYVIELCRMIMVAEEPLSAIDLIMTPGGDIRSDASEKLHNLNTEKANLGRQVQNTLDRLVKDYQIEHLLQDRFVTTREGRWVLPIKSGMQHGFSGIVHDASQSKQTVFMEPQAVLPLNNRLREIEIEIEQEIERLLIELSTYLTTLRFEFEKTRDTLADADVRLSQAELMVHLEAHPCEFDKAHMHLKEVRHPLLVLNTKKNVVANSVELSADRRILLLSGPNAGGKTVLLKSIGLAAQMARAGLPICAEPGSTLPFFKEIVISLGDSQSVDADLSTFAAHLKNLEHATKVSSTSSLILIDEICGSTDPEEGAALARSFIDTYLQNGVFGVITSHLGALKRGWDDHAGLVNGSLEFDKAKGPTYRFIMGVPGLSLAIQTAQRVGIEPQIIQAALNNLSPEVRKYQEALSEIDRTKKELLDLQDLLARELRKAESEKQKYEKMRADFERDRDKLLDKELRRASQKVEEAMQAAQVQEVFKRHEDLKKIKYDLPQIIKSSGGRSSTAGEERSAHIATAEEFLDAFPPGTTVHVNTLGRDGIIQGKANSKGEIPVLSNSMRLLVHWQDLRPARTTGTNPTQNILRRSGQFTASAFASGPTESDRVVDVRGLTADEAISQLEIQLDTASLGQEDRVKVVHGHGTETLKRTIRSYLSRSVYVKQWQAGTKDTGGDGVTWIELK